MDLLERLKILSVSINQQDSGVIVLLIVSSCRVKNSISKRDLDDLNQIVLQVEIGISLHLDHHIQMHLQGPTKSYPNPCYC